MLTSYNVNNLKPGEEFYSYIYSRAFRSLRCQFFYRYSNGDLFYTVAKTIEDARKHRDRTLIYLKELKKYE